MDNSLANARRASEFVNSKVDPKLVNTDRLKFIAYVQSSDDGFYGDDFHDTKYKGKARLKAYCRKFMLVCYPREKILECWNLFVSPAGSIDSSKIVSSDDFGEVFFGFAKKIGGIVDPKVAARWADAHKFY